jgi:NADPH:quinone reductase-like Zn-dependent oxidoreductase
MRAVRHANHGGPETLELVEVPEPEPGVGEVVVDVKATALNRLDVLQRQGPPLLPGFSLPHIPGMDVAGVISSVGPGVADVRVGERVIVKPGVHCGACEACLADDDRHCSSTSVVGGNRPGGYAEKCLVPASHVVPVPDNVRLTDAVVLPTAYSTAWRAVVATAHITAGETVLIHGAGSGVSIAGIQLGKWLGATVIVTSGSNAKLQRALSLGADFAVNHRDESVPAAVRRLTKGRGVDVVFDHVGPSLFDASLHSLRPRGRLVFCGTTTGSEVTFNLTYAYHMGLRLLGVDSQSFAEFQDMMQCLMAAGFEAVIDSQFPLAEAAAAQRRLESGAAFGKILLVS